jgi:hypothetical protein
MNDSGVVNSKNLAAVLLFTVIVLFTNEMLYDLAILVTGDVVPMVSLWYPYGIPMVSLWYPYGILMVSINIPDGIE